MFWVVCSAHAVCVCVLCKYLNINSPWIVMGCLTLYKFCYANPSIYVYCNVNHQQMNNLLFIVCLHQCKGHVTHAHTNINSRQLWIIIMYHAWHACIQNSVSTLRLKRDPNVLCLFCYYRIYSDTVNFFYGSSFLFVLFFIIMIIISTNEIWLFFSVSSFYDFFFLLCFSFYMMAKEKSHKMYIEMIPKWLSQHHQMLCVCVSVCAALLISQQVGGTQTRRRSMLYE